MPKLTDIFAALMLALTVVAVNVHTHDFGFVYDDTAVILERDPAWEQGWIEFLNDRPWGLGRHLTVASLDLNRGSADPLSPYPFHVTNTALTAVITVLLFLFARTIGLSTAAAFAGTLLFAVHPLHVDATVNIVGRAELLAALCVLGVVLMHINDYPPLGFGLTVAGLLFFFGLESKESAACAPVLAFAYDFFAPGRQSQSAEPPANPFSRVRIGVYLTYVIALAAFGVLAGGRLSGGIDIDWVDNPLAALPTGERVLHAAVILWRYAWLVLWPSDLRPDRAFDETPMDLSLGPFALGAWIAVAVALIVLRKRLPTAGFLVAWFPLAFIATSNLIFPIGTIMAERLTFLPSAGLCLLAGLGFGALNASGSRLLRGLGHGVLFVCAFGLAMTYHERSLVWHSEQHYHAQAAADSPRSAKAHYNLGLVAARAGDTELAARSFRRALTIAPGLYPATDYLTRVLREQGDLAGAADVYAAYVDKHPNDERALYELAHLYEKTGQIVAGHKVAQHLAELDGSDAAYAMLLSRLEAAVRREKQKANP